MMGLGANEQKMCILFNNSETYIHTYTHTATQTDRYEIQVYILVGFIVGKQKRKMKIMRAYWNRLEETK